MNTPLKQQNKEKCKNCLQNITCSFCEEVGCRKCMKNHFNSNAICIKKQTSTPQPTKEINCECSTLMNGKVHDTYLCSIHRPSSVSVASEPTMSEEWKDELRGLLCDNYGDLVQNIKIINFAKSLLLKAEERGYGIGRDSNFFKLEEVRLEENARCMKIAGTRYSVDDLLRLGKMSEVYNDLAVKVCYKEGYNQALQDFINNAKITK